MERVEHNMGGGFLATAWAMAITYAAGSLVALSGWVGDAWAHVTPGQAALFIGLLTYATHNVPKLARLLAGLYRKYLAGLYRTHFDGREAVLHYVFLSAVLALAGVVLLLIIFCATAEGASPGPTAGSPVVTLWNQFCASVGKQGEALGALNSSLHAQHPDRAIDARRLEFYTAAIVEAERQAALLRAMRRAEFGQAGEKADSGHRSPRRPPGEL